MTDRLTSEEMSREFPQLAAQAATFPVLPGEDPWTVEEITEVVADLLADQARVTDELREAHQSLEELLRDPGDGAGDDQADFGANTLERDQELSLVNNLKDRRDQIAHALDRIRSGEFGVCEASGGPIGKARLQAFPSATLSVAAKAAQERR